MLILSRKTSESIIIDGHILIKIVRIEGGMVKVGIDAPVSIPVHRQEVFDEIQRNNLEAIIQRRQPLPKIELAQVSLRKATPAAASPTSALGKKPSETESPLCPSPVGREKSVRGPLSPSKGWVASPRVADERGIRSIYPLPVPGCYPSRAS